MKIRLVQHDNWGTPPEVYDVLNNEFSFDFDPCPMHHKVDGLTIDWGKRNFVNPPYSRKTKEAFIRKAYEQSLQGKLSVLLLPVSTSTKIFHEVIYPNAEIRFWEKRIYFLPNGVKSDQYKGGQMDSMIVIFRPQAVGVSLGGKLTKERKASKRATPSEQEIDKAVLEELQNVQKASNKLERMDACGCDNYLPRRIATIRERSK